MADDFEINPQSEAFGDYLAQLGKTPAAAPVAPAPAPAIVPPQIRPQPVDKVAPLPAVVAAEPPTVRDYIADRLSKKDEELKAVQDQSAQDRKIAGVTEGVGQMIAGLSHSNQPFNPGGYQFLQDNAKQPVADYMQRQQAKAQGVQEMAAEQKFQRQAALEDVGSIQSTVARNLAKSQLQKYGYDPKIIDGMSAADTKEFMDKALTAMENRASHEELAKIARETNRLKREELNEGKANKRFSAFSDALDPNKGRTGEFGRQQGYVNSADRILVLAEQNPSLNFDKRQMQELAISTAALLSGGNQAAQHTVDALVPSSVRGDAAKLQEWLTGEPTGLQQQAFAKRMIETAQREKALAQSKVNDVQYSRVAQFDDLEKVDPAKYRAVMLSQGVNPDEYKAYRSNGYKKAAKNAQGKAHPQDGEAKVWAKENPNDPRAKTILELNGGM